ncbi:MAG: hypothetical protein FWG98_06850 [Candidatus Cloacimonetes bacterium]|nr:hypothetical protein [Candidatus Cloacimonadota bacterium]
MIEYHITIGTLTVSLIIGLVVLIKKTIENRKLSDQRDSFIIKLRKKEDQFMTARDFTESLLIENESFAIRHAEDKETIKQLTAEIEKISERLEVCWENIPIDMTAEEFFIDDDAPEVNADNSAAHTMIDHIGEVHLPEWVELKVDEIVQSHKQSKKTRNKKNKTVGNEQVRSETESKEDKNGTTN